MNFYLSFLNLLFLLSQYSRADPTRLNNPLYNLQNLLLDGYNYGIRPVKNPNTTTFIAVDLTLLQVIDIDDTKETILISGYLNLQWIDEGMTWDPSEFGGVSILRIPVEQIWNPDLFLYNAADSNSWNVWATNNVYVNLFPNGTAFCTPPAMLTTACKTDITNFPFDVKFCELVIASWMYTSEFINLTSGPNVFLDSFIENGQWSLDANSQEVILKKFEGQSGSYSMLHVKLNFRRRTLFYSFNFIIPTVLISVLSIFGFILPPDSGEKVGLQITNLLAVVFFVQYVSTIVPPSSMGIAKISIYLFSVSILCTFSLIGNVFVLNLFGRDIRIEKDMPKWFEVLIYAMGKFFRMKKIENSVSENTVKPIFEVSKKNDKLVSKEIDPKLYECIKTIQEDLSAMWAEMNERNKEEEKEIKWKYAAIVFDYFSFCHFFTP